MVKMTIQLDKVILMIRLSVFMAIILTTRFSLMATTDKYRAMWRDDPATTMVIGWNKVNGNSPKVYYDTEDRGTNWEEYAYNRGVDKSNDTHDMQTRFCRLSGLQPDTKYYFLIKDSNSVSPRMWFKTAPNTESDFAFVAGGDSRTNRAPRIVANKIASKLRPLFIMFGGDMIDEDTPSEWEEWLDDWQHTISDDGRIYPVVVARGNHEETNGVLVDMFDVPSNDVYYALSIGGDQLRAYVLNTEIVAGGAQKQWLEDDLDEHATSHTWRVAQYHRAMKPHTSSKGEAFEQYFNWAYAFYEHQMSLVIESDTHLLKRTFPIRPIAPEDVPEDNLDDYEYQYADGFIRDDILGTTYIGEGAWGAPLRNPNDDKPWTMGNAKLHQVNWVHVHGKDRMEVRTVIVGSPDGQVDVDNVGSVSDTTPFETPSGLDLWKPQKGPRTLTIFPSSKSPGSLPNPSGNFSAYITSTYHDISEKDNGEIVVDRGERRTLRLGTEKVGLRFQRVNIPQGATITNAYIQFEARGKSTLNTTITITGEASDNAPIFTTSDYNVSSRSRTEAEVTWNPPKWFKDEQGVDQRTANISSIIQEIINRNGWNRGNYLALILEGTTGVRNAKSFDEAEIYGDDDLQDLTEGPTLFVEYELDSPNEPPVVDAGNDQQISMGTPTAAVNGATISLIANLDDGANTIWEDSLNSWDLNIDNDVQYISDLSSDFPGINNAYVFPGDGLVGTGGGEGASFQDIGADRSPITIELWFKPYDLETIPSNGQVLWETGGKTGLGIFYNDGKVEASHDENASKLSTDVSSLMNEFIQVMVTYDPSNTSNNFKLYINGDLKDSQSRSDNDISGSDEAGIGKRGGSHVGGAGNGDSQTESFDGEISIFRAYDKILSASEVAQNYDSVAEFKATALLSGTVSDPNSEDTLTASWVLLGETNDQVIIADPSVLSTNVTFPSAGTYVFCLQADDGIVESYDIVEIEVDANKTPYAYNSSVSTNEGESLDIELKAFDAEGDSLTFSVTEEPSSGQLTQQNGADITYTPSSGFVGDDSFSFEVSDGSGTSNAATVSIKVEGSGTAGIGLSNGFLPQVDGDWQTVTLPRSYQSMVVVATPLYTNSEVPAIPRIRNAIGNSFEIKLQNPGDLTVVSPRAVHYTVVEEGVYNLNDHGIDMEAVKYNSTVTDYKSNLIGEIRSYANHYDSPVVLGQVMSHNDANWSIFWCRGNSLDDSPSSSVLFMGKNVMEDSNTSRLDEEVGYIVIEDGNYMVDGKKITAETGGDLVRGMGNNPGYIYSITPQSAIESIVLGVSGYDGGDGGWPVLYGDPDQSSLYLVFDEDQIGSSERKHTTEPVSYLIIEAASP